MTRISSRARCRNSVTAPWYARFMHTDNVYLDITYRIDEALAATTLLLRFVVIHERYSNTVVGVLVLPHFAVHDIGCITPDG